MPEEVRKFAGRFIFKTLGEEQPDFLHLRGEDHSRMIDPKNPASPSRIPPLTPLAEVDFTIGSKGDVGGLAVVEKGRLVIDSETRKVATRFPSRYLTLGGTPLKTTEEKVLCVLVVQTRAGVINKPSRAIGEIGDRREHGR